MTPYDQSEFEKDVTYGTGIGLAIGVGLGVVFGILMDDLTSGIVLGAAFGFLFGFAIPFAGKGSARYNRTNSEYDTGRDESASRFDYTEQHTCRSIWKILVSFNILV